MIGIAGRLVVLQMATRAGSARQVVIVVEMTVGAEARWYRMSSRQRKSHRHVVELRVEPGICPVTQVAAGRKASGSVVRIGGSLEV